MLKGHHSTSLEPSFFRLTASVISTSLSRRDVLALWSSLWRPFDPLKRHIFLVLLAPGLNAVLQATSHESRSEVDNPLPHPSVHFCFDAAQDTFGLPGCWLMSSFSSTRTPKSSQQGCLIRSSPILCFWKLTILLASSNCFNEQHEQLNTVKQSMCSNGMILIFFELWHLWNWN